MEAEHLRRGLDERKNLEEGGQLSCFFQFTSYNDWKTKDQPSFLEEKKIAW